jgi:nitrile hydratase
MNDLAETEAPARLPRDDGGAAFAQPWAARVFAIVVEMFGRKHYRWPEWVDTFSAEIRAPGHYGRPHADDAEPLAGDAARVDKNYSELWLAATERLLADKGLVSKEELDSRVSELAAAQVSEGSPRTDSAPRFAPSDLVVVRDVEPVGAAHLFLQVRAKTGVVERDLGRFAFPGEGKQHMYSVRFTAREIWGAEASNRDSLNFSLWESYLDPA